MAKFSRASLQAPESISMALIFASGDLCFAIKASILAGPHTYNFDHIYPELISAQGAKTVTDENHLADTLIALSTDVQKTIKLGQQAQKCVANNQGAISKTVNLIEHYLEK